MEILGDRRQTEVELWLRYLLTNVSKSHNILMNLNQSYFTAAAFVDNIIT